MKPLALRLLSGCSVTAWFDGSSSGDGKFDSTATSSKGLGAAYSKDGSSVRFQVYSSAATRIEVDVYDQAIGADEVKAAALTKGSNDIWSVELPTSDLPSGQMY